MTWMKQARTSGPMEQLRHLQTGITNILKVEKAV